LNEKVKNKVHFPVKNEKKEEINPLYVTSGAADAVEDAYAEVDKKKKKKGKGERVVFYVNR